MLVATAVELCEKYKLPWHAILEDTTRKYVRMVFTTRQGDFHLPITPPVDYGDWHGNLLAINSRVDGVILTYVLTKLKY